MSDSSCPVATFDDALRAGRARGLPSGEARLLLAHAAEVRREWLIAHGDTVLAPGIAARFRELVEARARGVPIAHLMGEREFYGRVFQVSAAVLIPRPETELLVQFAIDLAPRSAAVLDLGSGSGVLAVTVAAERPDLHVTAVDVSPDALALTQVNTERHAPGRVRCVLSDWMAALPGERYGVIVSNPPYIAADDPHLQRDDLRFEPRLALTDEGDGLECLRRIVAQSPQHLEPHGWLAVEHGYDQAADVRALFEQHGFVSVGSQSDLAGIERVTFGRRAA